MGRPGIDAAGGEAEVADHQRLRRDLMLAVRTTGIGLFRWHQDLIRLRLSEPSLRSREVDVVHVNDAARLLAFRRRDEEREHLVVASLATTPYDTPDCRLTHPSLAGTEWRERLNSDRRAYGGDDIGNGPAPLRASGDTLGVVVPASGVVVLRRIA